LFGLLAEASLYGTPFLFLGFVVRKGFSPERVAQLEHGGFLMPEYQKSSAAAPKQAAQLSITNSPDQAFVSRSLWVEAVGR
jgi:hypothetical protein